MSEMDPVPDYLQDRICAWMSLLDDPVQVGRILAVNPRQVMGVVQGNPKRMEVFREEQRQLIQPEALASWRVNNQLLRAVQLDVIEQPTAAERAALLAKITPALDKLVAAAVSLGKELREWGAAAPLAVVSEPSDADREAERAYVKALVVEAYHELEEARRAA